MLAQRSTLDRSVQIERIVKFSVVPGELVNRLLVQLNPFIQKSLVGMHEVVIACLESEGLGALSSIASKQGLDGSILLALHNEAKKENRTYKDDWPRDHWTSSAAQAQGQAVCSI